jgi:hypothetical protein
VQKYPYTAKHDQAFGRKSTNSTNRNGDDIGMLLLQDTLTGRLSNYNPLVSQAGNRPPNLQTIAEVTSGIYTAKQHI